MAPVSKASTAYLSKAVTKTTWQRPAESLATSSPVAPGIWISRKRTSGLCASIACKARTPSGATAQISSSGQTRRRSSQSSSASVGSSSAMTARGVMRPSGGVPCARLPVRVLELDDVGTDILLADILDGMRLGRRPEHVARLVLGEDHAPVIEEDPRLGVGEGHREVRGMEMPALPTQAHARLAVVLEHAHLVVFEGDAVIARRHFDGILGVRGSGDRPECGHEREQLAPGRRRSVHGSSLRLFAGEKRVQALPRPPATKPKRRPSYPHRKRRGDPRNRKAATSWHEAIAAANPRPNPTLPRIRLAPRRAPAFPRHASRWIARRRARAGRSA